LSRAHWLLNVVAGFVGGVVLAVLLRPGRRTWLAKPGLAAKKFSKK
jgi:hypothetical protein